MNDNKKCFVIFPFSEPYESRYKNIYEPALQESGLQVIRADAPGVEVIIENIEKQIRESLICFADLTEENANIWYEVGYAYACGKKVVMVCDKDKRKLSDLPFDIKHRNVIEYSKTIDKDEKARLKLSLKIIKDAEVKMANAQQAISAKKSVPVTPKISTPSKNPLDEIVHGNLTKNDIDVLREVINHHEKNNFYRGIPKDELNQKVESAMRLSDTISRLLSELYIEQRNVERMRELSLSSDSIFSVFPTEKALQFSRDNRNLF